MGCCSTLLRYTIFLFNFVFFITGAALIGLGSYMQIHMKNYFDFLGDTGFVNTSIFIIIVGVVVALISFFGCCGACTKNPCMMHTFGSFMLLIIIIEIGLGVTVYIYKEPAEMMKRELHHQLAINQVGFIDGVCLPVYRSLSALSPALKPMEEAAISNRER